MTAQSQPENVRLGEDGESVVLLAALAVAAGFAYLCFASMQGTNGFHKVYPYVSVWS